MSRKAMELTLDELHYLCPSKEEIIELHKMARFKCDHNIITKEEYNIVYNACLDKIDKIIWREC